MEVALEVGANGGEMEDDLDHGVDVTRVPEIGQATQAEHVFLEENERETKTRGGEGRQGER